MSQILDRKTKLKIFKIILVIIVIAIVIGIIVRLFPLIKNISTSEGREEFKETIQDSGFIGILMLFGLQLAQIFLIIIPGEPIEILAGMCYGGFGGTIFILISACIISTIIFMLVRIFGKKFVYGFCDKKRVKKILDSRLFQNPRTAEKVLFILFFVPGTPKDLLVYIAGLLPITPTRFILISTFARIPSVITSTLAGANIINGNWETGLLLYIGIIVLAIIIVLIMNKFDKHKIAEKAIDSIK